MSSDAASPAVEVSGLGKRYELYAHPSLRLLQTLTRGRRKYFEEFWALQDVSLRVERGETIGIVGRNGSGKSTLLQLVAGTLTPTTGTVRVGGRIAALLELGSGFNPEFTGRENVYLNGAILGISKQEMEQSFDAIAAFADIGAFIEHPLKTYSSGMVVRLAFAVAVHTRPDVLIIDEALAVGDTAFQSKCLDRIRRMQSSGVAIMLVSHASNIILEYCDRAAYLNRGRLVAVGDCRQVLERYTEDFIAAAGGLSISERSADGERSPDLSAQKAGPAAVDTQILAVTISDDSGAERHTFEHGSVLRVKLDVLHHAENASPCFGLQIKSVDDIVLWTCTTQLMAIELPPRRAGERASYEWRIQANFGGGRYVVAVGTGSVSTGDYLPHSRLHYAGHFDVFPIARHGLGWLEPMPSFATIA